MTHSKQAIAVILATFVVLTFTTAGWGADAKEYAIKIHRPLKAGYAYDFTGSGTHKMVQNITVGDKAPEKQEEALTFEVAGSAVVRKVDDQGDATEVAVVIENCVKVEGDKRTPLAEKGLAVTVSSKDGKSVVEAGDQKTNLSDEMKEILSDVIFIKTEERLNDEDVFGTNKPQKLAASWPVNAAKVAAHFGKLMPSVKKEDISGQVTLAATGKTDDVETYDLEVEFSIKDMMPGLPPDAKVEKSLIKVSLTGEFPVDPALQPLSKKQSMSMTGVVAMKGPNGEAIKHSMDMEKSTRLAETPKKP